MSGSYWRYIFAALGVILLLAVGYTSYQLYQSGEQQRADYRYQPAREPSRRVFVPSKAIPQGYQPNCANPDGNSNADLCAQWAAVDQVMEANRLASVNVRLALFISILTLIGTLFIGWTFWENHRTTRAELRAYVGVVKSRVRHFEVGQNPQIAIQFKNSGATPARRVAMSSVFFVGVADETAIAIPELDPAEPASTSDIGPGTANSLRFVFPGALTAEQYDGIANGDYCIYANGRIEYLDVFGRMHFTNFRVRQNPLAVGLSKMIYCAVGNEAN